MSGIIDNPGWAAWRHHMDQALMDAFRTLLWTGDCNGTADHEDCRGEDCDASLQDLGYEPDMFAPGAAREVEEDLEAFIKSCLAERPNCFAAMTADMVGYEFILTRQGQGAGFWDRGLGELGEWLADMAKSYGQQCAYVDHGNLVYVHN